jgi:cytoskeleton protein RodZ
MEATTDSTGTDEAPRSPGAILAAERERQGLSRTDMAQRLRMSVLQVEALETADYGRLPRGMFLRGFTRNYARSLGLDGEALVALLEQNAPRDRAPGIVVPSQNIRFDPLGARLASPYVKAAAIAAVAIVLGFAAMYWWLFVRPQGVASAPGSRKPSSEAQKTTDPQPLPPIEPARVDAPAPPLPEPVPVAAAPAFEKPVPPAPATNEAPPAPAPAASPADRLVSQPAPAVAPAEPVAASPGGSSIHLAFRGAAWVEITDARGKILVSRVHPAGTDADVAGKPPFSVVIGNAPEVRVAYNGREVDLAPHTRVAVARLTLP